MNNADEKSFLISYEEASSKCATCEPIFKLLEQELPSDLITTNLLDQINYIYQKLLTLQYCIGYTLKQLGTSDQKRKSAELYKEYFISTLDIGLDIKFLFIGHTVHLLTKTSPRVILIQYVPYEKALIDKHFEIFYCSIVKYLKFHKDLNTLVKYIDKLNIEDFRYENVKSKINSLLREELEESVWKYHANRLE